MQTEIFVPRIYCRRGKVKNTRFVTEMEVHCLLKTRSENTEIQTKAKKAKNYPTESNLDKNGWTNNYKLQFQINNTISASFSQRILLTICKGTGELHRVVGGQLELIALCHVFRIENSLQIFRYLFVQRCWLKIEILSENLYRRY